MFTLLTVLLWSSFFSFISVCAQTVNVSTGVGIHAYDGSCLQASNNVDNSPVTLQTCNGSPGQRWDISTSGPHILHSGFAIFILSGTSECLDSIAVSIYPEVTGVYTCGGTNDGSGGQAVHQAFVYNTFTNPELPEGPIVFMSQNDIVNQGNGPGQGCLTASQGKITTSSCDPASPASDQQFYLGSFTAAAAPATSPPSSTSSVQSGTASSSGPSATNSGKPSNSSLSGATGTSNSSNSSNPSAGTSAHEIVSGTVTWVIYGSTTVLAGAPQGTSAGPSSVTGAAGSSNTGQGHHVNAIAIAVPVALVSLLSIFALVLARRRRQIRQGEYDTQAARPFVPPSPAVSVVVMDGKGYQDLKESPMHSESASPMLTPIDNPTNNATSQDVPPLRQQTGHPVFQQADINRIVSMVVARIDPSGPQDHIPADAPSTHRPFSSDTPPPPAPDSPGAFSSQSGPNIDSILTALAARVDPSYREQAALRDSHDLPPLYQIPPGYYQQA